MNYIKVQRAAEILDVSEKSIRRLIASGELEAFRAGRAIRLREADVCAWLEARPVCPTQQPRWEQPPRPRRLPTTASALSGAKLRAQSREHEAA